MAARLESLFETIAQPEGQNPDKPIYSVLPIQGYESYFIGKDGHGHACLLVTASEQGSQLTSPIRLENLDVQFDLRCHVRPNKEAERAGVFTVVRCRSLERETVRYFLSVCDTIVAMIGDKPKRHKLAAAVHRLASIFQKIQKPPTRSVSGLFGELYLIWRSDSPPRAVAAWRVDEMSRFDFADGNIRIDVKATTGRVRAHTFSYEQCLPPPGSIAVAASLFVERSPGGISLRSIVGEVESSIAAYPDLVIKLHEVISATLGSSLNEALSFAFDTKLADSSFRFYDLREVPAIRDPLPSGVSGVHFQSDLSAMEPCSAQSLIDRDPAFCGLLPAGGI